MLILISYIRSLFRRVSKSDLTRIASSIYCSDYTLVEAIQIYGLRVKDVEFISTQIKQYNDCAKYINERLGE